MYRIVQVNIVYASAYRDPRVLEPLMAGMALDWARYSHFGWLLWTSSSIFEVTERLKAVLDPDDQFLVTTFNPVIDRPGGRLPKWLWDWMNQPRDSLSGRTTTLSDLTSRYETG